MQNVYKAKGNTIEKQYYDVGKLFAREINKSLTKIRLRRNAAAKIKILLAKRVLRNLNTNPLTKEFVKILEAWSFGAGISMLDATLLLADNTSGCQTVMLRYGSGVAMLHTEEDFDGIATRMTEPVIIEFTFGKKIKRTLVYNDLLPGAGLFGWETNKIVAVDSLFLSEDGLTKINKPMLANIVAWLIWRMDPPEAEENKIMKMIVKLGLSIDGYAINVIRKVRSSYEGYKLTFTRDEGHVEWMGTEQGSYLRQVNIIDPKYHTEEVPIARYRTEPRRMYKGGWKTFIARLWALDRLINKYKWISRERVEDPLTTHIAIQNELFGKLRPVFINDDLGATCVGLIDYQGTSASVAVVKKSKKMKVEMFI